MTHSQQIHCPHCQSAIYFDAKLLVSGMNFKCSNPDCLTSISISQQSLEPAKELIENYETKKQNILQLSHQNR